MERFYKRKVDLVVPQVDEHSQIAQTIKKVKVDTRRNGESKKMDSFSGKGFSNWKKPEKFGDHVRYPDGAHTYAWNKCNALMNQKQHIATFFHNQCRKDQVEYRIRLESSIDCIRFLLRQGLAFRGHNESTSSRNQGNFLELFKFMGRLKKKIKDVTLNNAPQNAKLISPKIQKDIVNAATTETINLIIKDIGDSLFSVLIDESRDISMKEHMAVVLRYVDKNGCIIERFLGLEHVPTFCQSHNIDVPEMNDVFIPRGRSRRKTYETTNSHHYRVELYYSIIDMQLQELNGRFDEVNTALLLCIACLCPDNLFVSFEKEKLIQLAGYYPKDFSPIDLMTLDDQWLNDSLVIYIKRKIFEYVSNECVMQRFQHMKTRRGNL
ncbi:Zinc finger MYM-type protein [Heracleum sosnowskyi]|uniref:Zinc finger MYM-type protein n=1 Tax=Heracleum sosnowskyi TaxID=360622 RepID=A0AAD8MPS8_9APIA|nr:Zinc finger MYM-type protein [Heracleum sosnowskyi]